MDMFLQLRPIKLYIVEEETTEDNLVLVREHQ